MDDVTKSKSYRPVSRNVNIGEKKYAVMDQEAAEEKGKEYLLRGRKILDKFVSEGSLEKEDVDNLMDIMTTAIDYGDRDAPYLLAHFILDGTYEVPFDNNDAILFLKIAAERHHCRASHQMACCYIGRKDFEDVYEAGRDYFESISEKDRKFLADYYFKQAEFKSST